MLNEGQVRELDELLAEIAADYEGVFSTETVSVVLNDSVARLMHHLDKHDYVPIFAARFTRERLDAVAHNDGSVVFDHPQVLFICQHNTGASILAAALFNVLADGRAHARSAGVIPGGELLPVIDQSLDELGMAQEFRFPRTLTNEVLEASDVVVTLGTGDSAPLLPGRRYLNWEEPQWIEADLAHVDRLREDLEPKVAALVAELIG